MCILEMVTQERPYSECGNPAQIYRKVVSGEPPSSLFRVLDEEVYNFIVLCMNKDPNDRPTCQELLESEFLQDIENERNKHDVNVAPKKKKTQKQSQAYRQAQASVILEEDEENNDEDSDTGI